MPLSQTDFIPRKRKERVYFPDQYKKSQDKLIKIVRRVGKSRGRYASNQSILRGVLQD